MDIICKRIIFSAFSKPDSAEKKSVFKREVQISDNLEVSGDFENLSHVYFDKIDLAVVSQIQAVLSRSFCFRNENFNLFHTSRIISLKLAKKTELSVVE